MKKGSIPKSDQPLFSGKWNCQGTEKGRQCWKLTNTLDILLSASFTLQILLVHYSSSLAYLSPSFPPLKKNIQSVIFPLLATTGGVCYQFSVVLYSPSERVGAMRAIHPDSY